VWVNAEYPAAMAGDRPALVGLLLYLLIAAAPTLLFWLALRALPAAARRVRPRRARPDPSPARDLRTEVGNLRRLRREVRARGAPNRVRRLALQAAYDETLLAVCDLVEVDAPLRTATGRDRAFARLQTEAALEGAGIVIDPPSGGAAAA
jgi:hypothetical protein